MTRGEQVLFIEDNEDVALAGTAMLETCGYQVLHFVTAEEGLEAFQSKPFALVLSDINLPGQMNGIDLATAIRRHKPETPIILATGYSEMAERAARNFTVLQKPYDMGQFRAAIEKVSTSIEGQ